MTTAEEKAAKILFITKKARSNFLKFTITQERELLRMYERGSLNIIGNIMRYSEKGLIPPGNWQRLLKEIQGEMKILGDDLTGIVHNGWAEGVKFGAQGQIDALTPIMPFEYQPELTAGFADINRQAVEMLTRRGVDGLLLSERVWDLNHNTLVRLKRDIGTAVATGRSADALSKEIRTYMTYTGEKGRGIYKSEYKNARRIARTETNRAYHEGSIRYMQDKDFIIGVRWNTTTGACNQCAPLDGTIYKKDEVPGIVHPHCMCYLTSVLDKKIFEKPEKEWMPVADDKYIDEWAKDSKYNKWLFHGTNKANAGNIFEQGFKLPEEKGWIGGRVLGNGFYFTDDKSWAEYFAQYSAKGRVLKAKLNIKNPYKADFTKGKDLANWRAFTNNMMEEFPGESKPEAMRKWFLKNGYDSLQVQQVQLETVVFNKEQIMVSKTVESIK